MISYADAVREGQSKVEEWLRSLGPGVALKLAAAGWRLDWKQRSEPTSDIKRFILITEWRMIPPEQEPTSDQ